MRRLARSAIMVAPLMVASTVAMAAPALADGGSRSWPSTEGAPITAGEGGTVVANGLQFSCHTPDSTPSWDLDGRTTASSTTNIQENYDPELDASSFSEGVTLWGTSAQAMQDYDSFWNDGPSFADIYSSTGWIDDGGGGGGGGIGGLQP